MSKLALLLGAMVGSAFADDGPVTHAPTETFAPTSVAFKERWWNVDHFDCFLNPNPVQVLSKNDGKNYSVSGLNVVTHVYDTIYNMGTYISDTYTNAVALYIDPEADSPRDARNYAFGNIANKLCAFDANGKVCLQEALKTTDADGPTVGVIWEKNYYYFDGALEDGTAEGFGLDNTVFVVRNFTNNPNGPYPPVFSTYAEGVKINRELADSTTDGDDGIMNIHDVTLLVESGEQIIADGDDGYGVYLLGVAKAKALPNGETQEKFVIMRIDKGTGLVDGYQVLPLAFDWKDPANRPVHAKEPPHKKRKYETSSFGAAFTYLNTTIGERVFFTANEGWGIYELRLWTQGGEPAISIPPTGCDWNTAANEGSHAACSAAPVVTLTWLNPSESTTKNDGMNCLYADPELPFAPTSLPTSLPSSIPAPVPTALPYPAPSAMPLPAPTLAPTTEAKYEEETCQDQDLHRYPDLEACCDDLGLPDYQDQLTDFLVGLDDFAGTMGAKCEDAGFAPAPAPAP